jgi:hypothetical protein
MVESNESKLKTAIRQAPESLPDAEVAEQIAEYQPKLVMVWAVEKLTLLVRSIRRERQQPPPGQMAFPFHNLAIRIPVRDGTVELATATIGKLRECERLLLKKRRLSLGRGNTLLGRIHRQIELMEPYAYTNRRITVERVQELIARGVPAPDAPNVDMGAAMRRYWESKTPEERSALARKRRKRPKNTEPRWWD